MDNAVNPREQRLHEVLAAYLEAVDAGWAPDPESLQARYPEFADDLGAFFVAQSRVAELAYPRPSTAQRRDRGAGATFHVGAPSSQRPIDTTAVGDYESLTLIKVGGMGSVFRAWQKGAKRWVALKKIKTGRFSSLAEVRRFRDEAEAAANLDHPNIVPIYEVGEHAGEPFFSMKLFEQGTLHQHLARFQKDQRATAQLLAKVARAVHYAHQRGILHRDLKPANILLDEQDQPYVADFGLAKRLDSMRAVPPSQVALPKPAEPITAQTETTAVGEADMEGVVYQAPEQTTAVTVGAEIQKAPPATVTAGAPAGSVTRVGTFVGTHGYVPPEHAGTSKAGTSTAADVYSLGAILYKILTGKTLFAARTVDEAIRLIRECAPEKPRSINPNVDERLEAICLKCLQKEPGNRYLSAQALAEDLERWLRGEPPQAWPLPWRLRAWGGMKRYFPIAAVAALVGFAAACLFMIYYYFDPERMPRALEEKAQKERVVLIGETGPPRWSRWNLGEGVVQIAPEPDKPLSFGTIDRARLELLRHAPAPRFRFAAEVRHDKVFGSGGAGIYIGYVQEADGEGGKRYWSDFTFADEGPLAKAYTGPDGSSNWSVAEFILQRHALATQFTPTEYSTRLTETRSFFRSAQTLKKPGDWRQLALEVTPDELKASFDGQPLKPLTMAGLRELCKSRTFGKQVVAPEFKFIPDGAIGVYVFNGRASFRNVTIQPLD